MKIVKAISWDIFRSVVQQSSGFIISIVLARLLVPEDFGVIAIALAIVNILILVSDLGLGSGLIQSKSKDNEIYSTIFWINLGLCIFLWVLVYFSAPYIASFLGYSELNLIIQALSFMLIINGFCIVQRAILQKELEFKKLAIIEVVSRIIGGGIGISLAIMGYGYKALIWQSLVSISLNATITWFIVSWRPTLILSFHKVKDIFSFSIYLFMDRLFGAVLRRFDVFFVGKFFSATQVGFYTRAESLNNFVVQNTSNNLTRVLFPVLSERQDDKEKFTALYKTLFELVAFITAFLAGVLFFLGEEIILILLGEKWLGTVFFFRILAFKAAIVSLISITGQSLISLGETKALFKVGMVRKILKFIPFTLGYFYGISYFIVSLVILSYVDLTLNIYLVNRFLDNLKKYHLIKLFHYYIVLIVFLVGWFVFDLESTSFLAHLGYATGFVLMFLAFAVSKQLDGYTFIKKKIYSILFKANKETAP